MPSRTQRAGSNRGRWRDAPRSGCVALLDTATGKLAERVEERPIVALLHLERERLDLPDVTAAGGDRVGSTAIGGHPGG